MAEETSMDPNEYKSIQLPSLVMFRRPLLITNIELKERNVSVEGKKQQEEAEEHLLRDPLYHSGLPRLPLSIEICDEMYMTSDLKRHFLDTIVPPQYYYDENNTCWERSISDKKVNRKAVLKLEEQLRKNLKLKRAAPRGICSIRHELYAQLFDELIRQVTVICATRGLLLLKLRDEMNMTLAIYESFWSDAVSYTPGLEWDSRERKQQLEEGEALRPEEVNKYLETKREDLDALNSYHDKLVGDRDELLKRKNALLFRLEILNDRKTYKSKYTDAYDEESYLKRCNGILRMHIGELLMKLAGQESLLQSATSMSTTNMPSSASSVTSYW